MRWVVPHNGAVERTRTRGSLVGTSAPRRSLRRHMRKLVLSLTLVFPVASSLGQTVKAPPAGAAPPPQVVSPSNRDADWRPTDSQINRVQEETMAYFAARDEGRLEVAYGKFSPSQRATVSLDSWRGAIEFFNATSGGVTARVLRKVTWYKDAPQGGLGVYAAVDFTSQAPNLALHCGFLVWQEQPDASFSVAREEDNMIDRALEAMLKPGDLERIRAQFGC